MIGPPPRLFHIKKNRVTIRTPRTVRTNLVVLLILFLREIELE
jgi:hypothetical protein